MMSNTKSICSAPWNFLCEGGWRILGKSPRTTASYTTQSTPTMRSFSDNPMPTHLMLYMADNTTHSTLSSVYGARSCSRRGRRRAPRSCRRAEPAARRRSSAPSPPERGRRARRAACRRTRPPLPSSRQGHGRRRRRGRTSTAYATPPYQLRCANHRPLLLVAFTEPSCVGVGYVLVAVWASPTWMQLMILSLACC